MTIAIAIYRVVHHARCVVEVYCAPCDAPKLDVYWLPALIDAAFGLGIAAANLYQASGGCS